MKSNAHTTYLLATGVLTWCGSERRSDRYGSVMILNADDPHDHDQGGGATAKVVPFQLPGLGIVGTLRAEVMEVRKSEHIGDLFRGITPGGAVVGETLVLGHGQLVTHTPYEIECVGDRVKMTLNGKVTCDIVDPDGREEGVVALQLHLGPEMVVQFKDLSIKELPKKE